MGRSSVRSRTALNAANFFLADMMAVVMPFLGTFLRANGWRYDSIGLAVAIQGLGTLLFQTPAGIVIDRMARRRMLLGSSSLAVGVAFALVPLLTRRHSVAIDVLLFASGAASAFFAPLLGALALALVGPEGLDRTVGANQGWNHAGNIAAAVAALWLVGFGVSWIFFSVVAISVAAAASAALIRCGDLDESLGAAASPSGVPLLALFRDRRVVLVFVATALFHLANAPVMPLVALAVTHVGGSERHVALVVLIAQATMIPTAWLAGRSCELLGRKATFTVGFVVLPLRIASYAFVGTPHAYLALQALDGIGAGIYGVAVVAICSDLTRGRPGFNTLLGVIATAQAVGGFVGPVAAGALVQHLGFDSAFLAFAAVAAVAAIVFLLGVPETRATPRRVLSTLDAVS